MNSTITSRPCVSADYEALRELYEIPRTFGRRFDADRDSKDRLDEQSREDRQSIFIAEEGGEIVGTVSIFANKHFAWLVRFAITDPRSVNLLYEVACKIPKERGHK